MALRTPATHEPTATSIPTTAKGIKKWVESLPRTDPGELTKQFYYGLRDLNRMTIGANQRLAIMEGLRPQAHIVIDTLRRHFVARTLPLTTKTRKIVHLTERLLTELAIGYMHPLNEVIDKRVRLKLDQVTVAIHRALRYYGDLVRTTSEVYILTAKEIWADIHLLYYMAEHNHLTKQSVSDPYQLGRTESTIEQVYVVLNLLVACQPQQFYQGEALRIAGFLEQNAGLCRITTSPRHDSEIAQIGATGLSAPLRIGTQHRSALFRSSRSCRTLTTNCQSTATDNRDRLKGQVGVKPRSSHSPGHSLDLTKLAATTSPSQTR